MSIDLNRTAPTDVDVVFTNIDNKDITFDTTFASEQTLWATVLDWTSQSTAARQNTLKLI